jgi:hypothetical protein
VRWRGCGDGAAQACERLADLLNLFAGRAAGIAAFNEDARVAVIATLLTQAEVLGLPEASQITSMVSLEEESRLCPANTALVTPMTPIRNWSTDPCCKSSAHGVVLRTLPWRLTASTRHLAQVGA